MQLEEPATRLAAVNITFRLRHLRPSQLQWHRAARGSKPAILYRANGRPLDQRPMVQQSYTIPRRIAARHTRKAVAERVQVTHARTELVSKDVGYASQCI